MPQLLSPCTADTARLGMERSYFRVRKDCRKGFIKIDRPDGHGVTIPIGHDMKWRRRTIEMAQIQTFAMSQEV